MRLFAAALLCLAGLAGCGGDSFENPAAVDLYKPPYDFGLVIDAKFDLSAGGDDGGPDLSADTGHDLSIIDLSGHD